jgi:ATP-dependent helicase IRC3
METFNDSTQSTIALRPYQQEALTAIAGAELKGVRRQLVALPIRTGKTVIFSHVVSNRPGRALVLAHREELIGQAAEKILTVNPAASIGVVKADRNELHRQIVVASVQTLARESRLSRIDTAGFTTVIVDEAHHAAADSYRRILEHFGCLGEDGPLTVGFTATPERADEKALGEIFSEIVYHKDILTMMRGGYLCDLRAVQVSIDADFNDLHSRHGDFIDSEASEMLMSANAPAHAVTSYIEHASGRKTLLFTPTVELSHRMVAAFTGQGIPAEALSGETLAEERRSILRRLKSGATRIVANCAVLTEGFDEPSVDCVIVARPTRSKPLYIQMIGRGTRLYPGKDDCLILDLVGVTTRYDLMTAASLFAVKPKPEQTISEAIRERETATRMQEEQEAAQGRLISQAVDLFRRRRFNWLSAGTSRFVLSIGKGMIVLTPDEKGWTARFNSREGTDAVELAAERPLEWAQGIAEDYARTMNAAHLIDPQAPWRMRPATEKQLSTLKRFRIRTLPNMSAGEASDLIAQAIGRIA